MDKPRRDDRLAGKVAIVTGAGSRASGIGNGRAASIVLARHGARVTLVDAMPEWAEETARMVREEGGECIVVQGDVGDAKSCADIVERTVDAFGRCDILINNVGVTGPRGNALEVDIEAWAEAMHINVTSMVLMARYAIPEMKRNGGGSIVNIASVAGLQGGHPSLLYPTSKGAVVNLTRVMAAHHGRDGIRVNCIAPGSVYTPMVATRGMTDEMRAARVDQTLLGVEGTGWDIGYGCLFLASDESRWITGVILPIDGGRTAGRPKSATPPSDGKVA